MMVKAPAQPRRSRTGAVAGMVLLALAGCGNSPDEGHGITALQQIGSVVAKRQSGPIDPAIVEREVRAVLAQVDGPMMVGTEVGSGTVSVLGVPVANGRYRTWRTPGQQAIVFKDGVLTGTRGLGYDLMATEADRSIALIRGLRSGTAQRVYYHLTGDNAEVPLVADCVVTPRGSETIELMSGRRLAATRVDETCLAGDLAFENAYWVTGGGEIVQSVQWISRERGSLALQVLRS